MDKKTFDFMGKRKIFFIIPIVALVITLVANFIMGTKVAIEFRGGAIITYSYSGDINTDSVKSDVEQFNLGAVVVTTGSAMGSDLTTLQVSFASSEGITAEKQTEITTKLKENYKDNDIELLSSQDVNPRSGGEFFLKCLVAVLFSFVLLVIYIAFRFKKIGGLSAGVFSLVALIHDVFMVYAVFVFFQFPIDANFMAVVLTILGNSINDTIVVYDRVRENKNLYGNSLSLRELTNLSIKQSITRAINTTVTTGFAILAICVVCAICGVTSIMTFAFPMVIGLICGTFSSLCIAPALWVMWQEHKEKTGKGTPLKVESKQTKNVASKAADPKKIMV